MRCETTPKDLNILKETYNIPTNNELRVLVRITPSIALLEDMSPST